MLTANRMSGSKSKGPGIFPGPPESLLDRYFNFWR